MKTGTIRQILHKKGWQTECKTFPCRAMNVQIGFVNAEGNDDETEFSINAWDEKELQILYNDFCKENNIKNNTVFCVAVVQCAETMEELD